jgi:hypothetical protein
MATNILKIPYALEQYLSENWANKFLRMVGGKKLEYKTSKREFLLKADFKT